MSASTLADYPHVPIKRICTRDVTRVTVASERHLMRKPRTTLRRTTAVRERERDEPDLPNAHDPLSEPLRHRRLWACYLHRGYTRATFAAAMETTYAVVHGWDHHTREGGISLAKLEKASRILRFSMDELCFGKRQTLLGREPALSDEEIRDALAEVGATHEERTAFGEHAASPVGRYQEITRSYVHGWLSGYRGSRGDVDRALVSGVNARAMSNAVASRREVLDGLHGLDEREKLAVLQEAISDLVSSATVKTGPTSPAKRKR